MLFDAEHILDAGLIRCADDCAISVSVADPWRSAGTKPSAAGLNGAATRQFASAPIDALETLS